MEYLFYLGADGGSLTQGIGIGICYIYTKLYRMFEIERGMRKDRGSLTLLIGVLQVEKGGGVKETFGNLLPFA